MILVWIPAYAGMTSTPYFISSPTAIDRLMAKIRFNGSRSLRDKRVTIKNIGKVIIRASFFVRNILNRKKKKKPIIIFIIVIIKRFAGAVKNAKEIIKPKISNKKISFFPNFPVASLISFYYNGKLWLK